MTTIDELIEVLQAKKAGKQIQYKRVGDSYFHNAEVFFNTIEDMTFKIEPTAKLRPYANAMEFLYAMKEHGPYITRGGEPYAMATVVGECAYDVWVEGDNALSYADIFKLYEWQDGTPCGIEEGGEQ